MIEVSNLLNEKKNEIERLNIEHESLMKVEEE